MPVTDNHHTDENSARSFYAEIAPETDPAELEKAEIRAAALERLETWEERGLRLLAQYRGNRNMALDCYLIALGKGHLIGIHEAVQVSVKHFGSRKKKAACTKCIAMFRDCLDIKGMPGQRSDTGRV